MILTIKHRLKYYKKFRSDIWGLCKLSYRSDNVISYKRVTKFFYKIFLERLKYREARFKRFSYRLDIIAPRRRFRFLKKRFISLRVVKLFYLTLTYKQFKRLARIASKKDGLFEKQFCLLLEGRLISFLYRTSFVSNMFEAFSLVKKSFILINRKRVNFANMPVNLFEILSFDINIKSKIYYDFMLRLRLRRSLFNPPKYMFVSYWFLFAYMRDFPAKKQLIFPGPMDIYRATGFAF